MAKKQGKIISIPVKEVTEGMQVIYHNSIYNIIKICNESVTLKGGNLHVKIAELKTLVVEYDHEIINDFGASLREEDSKQLPLKYSQWQAALDNGEVDSDKVVEFEIITKNNNAMSYTEAHQEFQFAKIIPRKEDCETLITAYKKENAIKSIDRDVDIFLQWLFKNYYPPKRK